MEYLRILHLCSTMGAGLKEFDRTLKKRHTEFITNKPQYNRLHLGIYCVNDRGSSMG